MPDGSGASAFDDPPESIIVWEILVRLPPKDLLRCRSVCKSWRGATSPRDFLVAHHRHQPSLPVLRQSAHVDNTPAYFVYDDPRLVVFHDAGAGAGSQKLWPVLRYASREVSLHACLDGLLVVSEPVETISYADRGRAFYICNPATRQYAPLPQLLERGRPQLFKTFIAGLYLHHPSGEYRVLYFCWAGPRNRDADFYITSIGPDEPRRFIGRPPPSPRHSVEQALLKGLPYSTRIAPVLHRGGLHWDLGRHDRYYAVEHGTTVFDIMVFDTAVETFRWLRRPAQAPLGLSTLLLELDGALALFSISASDGVVMDVFVMRDYADEVWASLYRIDLSTAVATAELPPSFELMMVLVNERELLIHLPGGLLHCHIDDGKVLGIMEWLGVEDAIQITTHLLRQSIVPLPFFETQQGTGANNNGSPVFLGF